MVFQNLLTIQKTLTSISNDYGTIITITCTLITIDLLTGLTCSHINHKINSATGRIGFWKKFALIMALVFGITIDIFIDYMATKGLISSTYFSPIGHLSAVYIAVNECISICENLKGCGIDMSKVLGKKEK